MSGALASVRRGRLDRAAQILPHLDPVRLLVLLRGDDLGYELNNRPDWVSIPLQGILQTVGAAG